MGQNLLFLPFVGNRPASPIPVGVSKFRGRIRRLFGGRRSVADRKSEKIDLVDFIMSTQNALGLGVAFLDPKNGKILRTNAVFCGIFGYTDKELLALPSIVSLVPSDHQNAFRDRFKNIDVGATFEIMALHKNRNRVWLEVRLRSLRMKDESRLAAVVTDITRRREAEEQVLLLETITLAVNEARDFHSALSVVVRKVCVATGWEYGVAWVPSGDGKTISVSKAAYGGGDQLERFRRAMEGISLAAGDDLPGRAWMLRQPQWADEILLLRSFRRQTILREFGVQISMAIPVIAEGKVVAILEFCVTEKHLHVKDFFVGLASAIAPQLGSVFQRKKAEEDRDRIFALSIDLICVASYDNFLLQANPAWTKCLGYTIEELTSRPFLDFVHPEDREATARQLAAIREGAETRNFENRYIAKDGSVRWLAWSSSAYNREQLIYAIARDVTDRKAHEEETLRTSAFLDQIIENIPDMIFIKDAKNLRFVRFNKAGEKLLGISRNDMIGKNDHDFFPPEEADFFIEKDRQVLKEGRLVEIPEEVIHTKNGVRILHTKKIPILDADKKPIYLLGISEDVTDRKSGND